MSPSPFVCFECGHSVRSVTATTAPHARWRRAGGWDHTDASAPHEPMPMPRTDYDTMVNPATPPAVVQALIAKYKSGSTRPNPTPPNPTPPTPPRRNPVEYRRPRP